MTMGKATSTCDMPDQNECIVVDVANAYVVDNAADYAEEWDNLPNSEGERDAPDLTVQELKNKSIAEFSVRGGGERSTDGYKQDKKGKGTASRRNKKRKHFVSRTCDDCFDKNDNDDPLIQRSVAKFYRGEDGVKRIYFGTIVSAGSIGEYEMYRITYGDGDSEYTMKEDINELLQVYRENMNKYVDMQVIDTYSKAQQIVKNCTLENTREKVRLDVKTCY